MEWKRLNIINLYDNDLDPSTMALTNDHIDFDIECDLMNKIKIDYVGINESQHDIAWRKLKNMHASRISDWLINDKNKSMVNMEMKPLVVDIYSNDNQDSKLDAVLTKTPLNTY